MGMQTWKLTHRQSILRLVLVLY